MYLFELWFSLGICPRVGLKQKHFDLPQTMTDSWNLLGNLEGGLMVRGLGPNIWFVQILESPLIGQMT